MPKTPTLNELIEASLHVSPEDVEEEISTAPAVKNTGENEVEKLASVLELLGTRGIGSFMKVSSEAPPPGTNVGRTSGQHVQAQVPPGPNAPPMSQPPAGAPATNENRKAVGKTPDLQGGQGTHHPALASNQAAADFTKVEKAKAVEPELAKVLSTPAFADPKVKENFSHTGGGVDKNFKAASVNKELLRQAIATKLAEQKGAQA